MGSGVNPSEVITAQSAALEARGYKPENVRGSYEWQAETFMIESRWIWFH
jgi:hypothetical protein